MSRRSHLLVAMLSLPALVGCSFLFNFDGYTGDGGPADVANDVAPKPFCASQPPPDAAYYFCDDFDEADSGYPGSCSSSGTMAFESILPDDDSPPNAMFITIPSLTPSTYGMDECQSQTTTFATEIAMAFDVKADTSDGVFLSLCSFGDIELALLVEAPWSLRESSYQDGGGVTKHPLLSSPSLAQWHRVSIDWVIGTSVSVTLDGKSALSATPTTVPVTGSGVDFRVGVEYFGGVTTSADTHFQFDNVQLIVVR